jgi:hypothetical protein
MCLHRWLYIWAPPLSSGCCFCVLFSLFCFPVRVSSVEWCTSPSPSGARWTRLKRRWGARQRGRPHSPPRCVPWARATNGRRPACGRQASPGSASLGSRRPALAASSQWDARIGVRARRSARSSWLPVWWCSSVQFVRVLRSIDWPRALRSNRLSLARSRARPLLSTSLPTLPRPLSHDVVVVGFLFG